MKSLGILEKYLNEKKVRVAITGLSRSGKTVFITSLIDQLQYPGKIQSIVNKEFIAELLSPKADYQRFRYDSFEKLIKKEKKWPEGTSNITKTTIRLEREKDHLFSGPRYADMELIDYPGEWILDISMMGKTFDEWSLETLDWIEAIEDEKAKEYIKLTKKYAEKYGILDEDENDSKKIQSPFDKKMPKPSMEEEELHKKYVELLYHLKKIGYSFLVPGRFIMPDDMEDSNELFFSPINRLDSPIYDNFRDRFIKYVQSIVREIHLENFMGFDRQIVLIDLLTAYKNGPAHYYDMKKSIETIMSLYEHKKQNILMQWMHPSIKKVLFVGTKVDLIPSSQRQNYLDLLEEMVQKTKRELKIKNIEIETNVMASIRTAEDTVIKREGREVPAVKGYVSSNKIIKYHPGNIPSMVPSEDVWKKKHVDVRELVPNQSKKYKPEEALDHINMDLVIKSLIGDLL